MAHWVFTTSGSAIAKGGWAASGSYIVGSGSLLQTWSDQAEGFICANTRRDWLTNYATLNTAVKYVLDDIASSKIAMNIVAYDPTGYLTREADMIMNKNDEIIQSGLQFLKDFKSNSLQTP